MKKILALLLFILILGISQTAFASKIPEAELDLIKGTFPEASVRFDGMLELPDGTKYIPVYPLKTEFPETEVKLSATLPENKSIKDKPDFFMFNTNFAFFKVKQEKDKSTIIYSNEIPVDVKMGLLPQDLLVPAGFQIPAELRIIIGDLIIPITPIKEYKEVVISTGKEVKNSPRATVIEATAEQLSGKYFYTTSFNQNALTALNANTGKAFKQIEFASIPSDMKLANQGKYLLVSTIANDNIFVVDSKKSEVLKEIKVGIKPFFIAVSNSENLAYIANRGESTISVIDLVSMQPKEQITVKGTPCYLELSADGKSLYYLDAITGTVYSVIKTDDAFVPYTSQPLFRSNNISKIQLVGDRIYSLDRGKSVLEIFYINGKPKNEVFVDVAADSLATDDEAIPAVNTTAATDTEVIAVQESSEENIKAPSEEIQEDASAETVTEETAEKEKLTLGQTLNKYLRKLLYYTEDTDEEVKPQVNPENQIIVLDKFEEEEEPEEEKPASTKKEAFKRYVHEFLNYKEQKPAIAADERIRLRTEKRMDFITAKNRANDFLVVNEKIYLLCSDDYLVHVYDAMTNEWIKSFELEQIGYYNALKVSQDKKIGIVTNISSQALTIFDTKTDAIVQKLPLFVNVHNVVITDAK